MSVKELLTGLADSIRLKSGKSGKMTLEEMAAALMGVTVEGDIGFTCGTFAASSTGSAKVVNHGLGQEPGAVIFIKAGSTDSSTSSSSTTTFYDSLFCVVYSVMRLMSGKRSCMKNLRLKNAADNNTRNDLLMRFGGE